MNLMGRGLNSLELASYPYWMSLCYVGGGLLASALFYVGSLMLFPFVFSVTDGIWYSSSLFLAGSIIVFLSSTSQAVYSWFRCRTTCKGVLIQVLSLGGWFAFLVGSVLGSPRYDLRSHRDLVYVGSITALLVSQVAKLIILVYGSSLPLKQVIARYTFPFYSEVYLTISMVLYLFGTIVFLNSEYCPYLSIVAPPFYVFGALAMIISNIYLWKGLGMRKEGGRQRKQLIEYEQRSCQIGSSTKSEVHIQDNIGSSGDPNTLDQEC